jgi:hypothetical protein
VVGKSAVFVGIRVSAKKRGAKGLEGRELINSGKDNNDSVVKEEIGMHLLKTSLVIFLFSFVGCATGAYNVATLDKQEAGSGYCHKKLQPIGPTDPARPTVIGEGDYIDYYGPCDGPSIAEQIQQQKRFEQFRFGRDYMDEG